MKYSPIMKSDVVRELFWGAYITSIAKAKRPPLWSKYAKALVTYPIAGHTAIESLPKLSERIDKAYPACYCTICKPNTGN